jgi:predicted SpoU family rRNA methylase
MRTEESEALRARAMGSKCIAAAGSNAQKYANSSRKVVKRPLLNRSRCSLEAVVDLKCD